MHLLSFLIQRYNPNNAKVNANPSFVGEIIAVKILIDNNKLAIIRTAQIVQVVDSTYHDKFGVSKKNKCLLITGTTPFNCKISISWK